MTRPGTLLMSARDFPARLRGFLQKIYLGVAQLVARELWKLEVAGSSPATQTI